MLLWYHMPLYYHMITLPYATILLLHYHMLSYDIILYHVLLCYYVVMYYGMLSYFKIWRRMLLCYYNVIIP